MNPCKDWEPAVINNELILKCINEQLPKGEIGRLAKEEGIPIEEITEIRFEYKNILRIDYLWILTSLTKLGLNNNYIEKIENLNMLTHLQELDLSFNKISKIENLDALVQLRKFSLYENQITNLENMDKLVNLTVFSIGKNSIEDIQNVQYLRQFSKLTSLNMAGNACAEAENFRQFVAVFLPQLVYYEYKSIKQAEKEEGEEIFKLELRHLLEFESTELAAILQKEKEKADAELHSLSFVEYLNADHLFKSLFEDDAQALSFLEMGEEAQEFYNEFQKEFIELCQQVFSVGQLQYESRITELNDFQSTVEEAKKSNQEESIGIMESFLKQKSDIFAAIKKLEDDYEALEIVDEYYNENIELCSTNFDDAIHETWKQLMKLEIDLFEQLEDINQTFEHVMTDMVNSFVEEAQSYFSQMRSLEVTYTENISDLGSRYMTNVNMDETIYVPDSLKPLMANKEVLSNVIGAIHDSHLLIIDTREDTLINRAKQWQLDLFADLNTDEIVRNRTKVLEINHFLDIQREELEDLISEDLPIVEIE